MRTVSSIPSWTGQEGDAVFYAAGNVRRMYAYLKDQWNYFGFLDNEGTIIVDGTIEIGTYLKANATDGLWLGHETWASGPFRVDINGNLVATSATISGSITASSGTIGGWTISAGLLSTGSGGTAVGMAPATYPFYAGNTTAASAPFRVDNSGNLTATSATITGSISATTGTIGGWDIGATSISSSSNAIILNDDTELITVGAVGGTHLQIDGANLYIQSSDYSAGSAGWRVSDSIAEFQNIRARGKISTSVFEKDTITSIGGNFVVMGSDILDTDMTALDASTMTISGDEAFAVGDFLRIKDGEDNEWFEVTNVGSAPTYTVTRDKGGEYGADSNPTWEKGNAVVNYGASGQGHIFMTASETNAPYMSVITHAGAPWTTLTERGRFGNLNGFLGYSSDLYGIAIGETEKYLKYDPTNGLRIRGDITMDSGTLASGVVTADSFVDSVYGDISVGAVYARKMLENNEKWIQLGDAVTLSAGSFVKPGTEDLVSGSIHNRSGYLRVPTKATGPYWDDGTTEWDDGSNWDYPCETGTFSWESAEIDMGKTFYCLPVLECTDIDVTEDDTITVQIKYSESSGSGFSSYASAYPSIDVSGITRFYFGDIVKCRYLHYKITVVVSDGTTQGIGLDGLSLKALAVFTEAIYPSQNVSTAGITVDLSNYFTDPSTYCISVTPQTLTECLVPHVTKTSVSQNIVKLIDDADAAASGAVDIVCKGY